MLDKTLSPLDRAELVDALATGLHVDPQFLARGDRSAKKTFVGRFKLDDPSGPLHVSNVAREVDRTMINGSTDSHPSYWERDQGYARVYCDPDTKRAVNV